MKKKKERRKKEKNKRLQDEIETIALDIPASTKVTASPCSCISQHK